MSLIIQKLKEWRDELARKSNKPAYYILTNKNLEDALDLNPENYQELETLNGWGPKKVEKYGDDVLRIIRGAEEIEDKNLFTENQTDETILSVAQYVNFINLTIQQFGEIKVTGEINDLSGVSRGLAFFDLKDTKDKDSTMQCVVFRNNFQYLSHLLEDGLEVIVYGLPSIYPKNGNFKFVVTRIEPVGEGSYKKALEVLKKKLIEKGYFSEERKRVLPEVIKKIGLITSNNGAAIHDFKRNLEEFGFEVFLKNVYVEGDQAEASIIQAIKLFNRQARPMDVLVMIRGGGSWESLKTFNSEKVVEAVISSKIPIITGIGHENDETFVGLSSDFNCSTPSITATYLSQSRKEILEKCFQLNDNLQETQEDFLNGYKNKIVNYLNKLSSKMENFFNQFNQLKQQIFNFINEKIFQANSTLEGARVFSNKLISEVENNYKNKVNFIDFFETKLGILNPKKILSRGYALIYQGEKVLDSIQQVDKNKLLKIEFRDGFLTTKIKKIINK